MIGGVLFGDDVLWLLQVTNYLLDISRLLDDEATYKASLEIEPRQPRVSVTNTTSSSAC